jgi:hypothetical protein
MMNMNSRNQLNVHVASPSRIVPGFTPLLACLVSTCSNVVTKNRDQCDYWGDGENRY